MGVRRGGVGGGGVTYVASLLAHSHLCGVEDLGLVVVVNEPLAPLELLGHGLAPAHPDPLVPAEPVDAARVNLPDHDLRGDNLEAATKKRQ